jgi:hypothetical protein
LALLELRPEKVPKTVPEPRKVPELEKEKVPEQELRKVPEPKPEWVPGQER